MEFYGDFWHMNPKLFKNTSINSVNKKSAEEIWSIDKIRNEALKSLGWDVIIVWESEFKNNPIGTVESVTKKILEIVVEKSL